jgi:hypothetical protein
MNNLCTVERQQGPATLAVIVTVDSLSTNDMTEASASDHLPSKPNQKIQ